MCRFNIIYVKGEKAQEYLARKGYRTFGEFGEDWQGCQGYVYGACNCSSMVGSMDGQSGSSYDEMYKYRKEQELERLYEIRELMRQPDYKAMRGEYQSAKGEIYDQMEELTAEVEALELQMMDDLYQKYDGRVPLEESEKMYEELEKKRAKVEGSPEYQALQGRLDTLLGEHFLLEESCRYYLTMEEQEEALGDFSVGGENLFVPADEFVDVLSKHEETPLGETKEELEARFSNVFTAEEIGFEPELMSCVIDDVIKRLQAENGKEAKEEFWKYRTLFRELLDTGEQPLFTTVWSEPENLQMTEEYSLDELKMEHLAGLGFDQVIRIV